MENKDVADAAFGCNWVFRHEFRKRLLGLVFVVKVGDAVHVAAVFFSPACAPVSWEMMD